MNLDYPMISAYSSVYYIEGLSILYPSKTILKRQSINTRCRFESKTSLPSTANDIKTMNDVGSSLLSSSTALKKLAFLEVNTSAKGRRGRGVIPRH